MSYGSKNKPYEIGEIRSKLELLKMKKQVPSTYIAPFANSEPYATDYPNKSKYPPKPA